MNAAGQRMFHGLQKQAAVAVHAARQRRQHGHEPKARNSHTGATPLERSVRPRVYSPRRRTLLAPRAGAIHAGQKNEEYPVQRTWLQQYPAGVPTDIDPGEYASLRDLFEEAVTTHGNKPAYTNLGATLTFAQLDELTRAFAAWLLQKSGLVPGDRVALMMPNVLQYPIALFGVLRAGMVVVNTNPLYTARELEHQLKDSGAKCIVIVENFAHVLQQVLPHTDLKQVLVTAIGDLLGLPRGVAVNFVLRHVRKQVPAWNMPGAIAFKSALSSGLGLKLEPPALGPTDIAFLQYTGGTTGIAKAAVLTHRNMIANVLQTTSWIFPAMKAGGARVVITALPLYHIFALTTNCLAFLPFGACNVLITNPRDFRDRKSTR